MEYLDILYAVSLCLITKCVIGCFLVLSYNKIYVLHVCAVLNRRIHIHPIIHYSVGIQDI